MPVEYEKYYAAKRTIVDEIFIKTADENYVVARWCFCQGMNVDFFWLAVHCVEKYLKAVLVLNGHTSKHFSHEGRNVSYGHNIMKLYDEVSGLAPELLPADLTKPDNMPPEWWNAETVGTFVKRLHDDGQADNRYQIYGYSRRPEDLSKLDELVFSIRRLCRPLEAYALGKEVPGARNISWRQTLALNPKGNWNLQCKLEDIYDGKRGELLRAALLKWNFAFAPEDYQQEPIHIMYASQNPVLIRRILDTLEAGSQHFAEGDALWAWTKGNIKIPQDVIRHLEEQRAATKVKVKERERSRTG
jgi:hypothetical protein